LQVHWQETLRGHVAGVMTTQRVLIVSADLEILATSSTKFDKGLPAISFGNRIAFPLTFKFSAKIYRVKVLLELDLFIL